MAQKKNNRIELVIIFLLIGIGVVYFLYTQGFFGQAKPAESDSMLVIELYDKNDVKLGSSNQQMFAIANNIQNADYAIFDVNTKNVGQVAYTAKLADATPSMLYQAFEIPQTSQHINPDGTGTWKSKAIKLDPLANQTLNFTATLSITFDNGKIITKTGSILLRINESTVTSGGGGGGGGGGSGTDLCTGITCNSYCSGVNWRYGGYCKVVLEGDQGYQPDCYFDNITWYSPDCGWDYATNITCGDGYCNSATNQSSGAPYECCYVSSASEQYKCKTGAPLCTEAVGSCDPDCKQYQFVHWLPAIQLG